MELNIYNILVDRLILDDFYASISERGVIIVKYSDGTSRKVMMK